MYSLLMFIIKHFSTAIWDCNVTVNKSYGTDILNYSYLEKILQISRQRTAVELCSKFIFLVKYTYQKIPKTALFPCKHFPKLVEKNLKYNFSKLMLAASNYSQLMFCFMHCFCWPSSKQDFKTCIKRRKSAEYVQN